MMRASGPHQGQPVYSVGAPLEEAAAAMVLLHGRGASAGDILTLAQEIDPGGIAYLAPQAAGFSWYPYRFLEPLERNEPYLSSALQVIADLLGHLESAGIAAERTLLLGFSQGACLAVEFAARNARRYAGLVGLSGGLIGPEVDPERYNGSLAGTPVFLGCSDVDFHIPKERVEASARMLGALGGDITLRLYPGMDHTVNQDELDFVRRMVTGLDGPEAGR